MNLRRIMHIQRRMTHIQRAGRVRSSHPTAWRHGRSARRAGLHRLAAPLNRMRATARRSSKLVMFGLMVMGYLLLTSLLTLARYGLRLSRSVRGWR